MAYHVAMTGIPERTEAAEYYFKYIDRIKDRDITGCLEQQLQNLETLLHGISEEKSLYRYAADKWSIRQVWSHINDTERVFLFRALWFARGFKEPLPSFDQDVAAAAACADERSWTSHVEEFRVVRRGTLAFFRSLPEETWMRRGTASGNPFTVRALAYIVAGHAAHHAAVLQERYLS